MISIFIQNGHVIDPASRVNAVTDILVENGKVKKVGKLKAIPKGTETFNAKGKLVVPGFVDLQVHLREPGFEGKETIKTGLRSALKGGITSVVSMPNTNPATDSSLTVRYQYARAEEAKSANLFVAGAITKGEEGKELADIRAMKDAGIVAVTDDGRDVQNAGIMKKAMEYCRTYGIPLLLHSEEESISGEGAMHEGKYSTLLGLPGIPAIAEDIAVMRNLLLAEATGAKIHLMHVSTRKAVEFIETFLKRKVKVTAETCPQYFVLTDAVCDGFNTMAKMYPPLRSEDHRRAIIKGLKSGVISVISTDHAPHTRKEKLKTFTDAAKGTVGLETSFALGYTHLVLKKEISLSSLIEKMTANPAKVISVPKGTLSPGRDADIAIIDPGEKWTIRNDEMETKGRNCVFEGMKVQGRVKEVFVSGEWVVRNGKVL